MLHAESNKRCIGSDLSSRDRHLLSISLPNCSVESDEFASCLHPSNDLSGIARIMSSFFMKKGEKRPVEEKENQHQKKQFKATPVDPPEVEKEETFKPLQEHSNSIEYGRLCETFEKIENTTKRLLISSYLTDFFGEVIDQCDCQTLIECVYLCLNRIGPDYEGKELGIGESLLIKAVAAATGRKVQAVKAEVEEKGDLGLVAQSSKGKQMLMSKPKPHTVHSVFEALKTISNFTGASSQQRKVDTISKMLLACKNSEPKYLIRSLEGKLRIGLAQQTILISLTHAAAMRDAGYKSLSQSKQQQSLQDAVIVVKQVFSEMPCYDFIIPKLLEFGWKELPKHCQLTPGIPLKPMLAHPTKSISDVLNRFEGMSFTCEYKYDGERAQIHRLEDGRVMVYSRNSENLSEKYPDVIQRMPKCPKEGVKSFVMDCEAVAWDVQKECILPFQVLSTRKRKDVSAENIQVQVCIFAFDLLYLNGEALVTKSLQERRELLYASFDEVPGEFMFAKGMNSQSIEDIQTFLDASIAGSE
jgi:DNA ligase-1